ncbi:TetR/AcrR family transcriptional regulator [Paenibacillus sp. SC116]|uniref:TetR/AcrR family transcriptional regulator n=1 Tax=Paenibacillus sp. SC116 TaxID=2968986 RepID=UPI00215B32C1|nr:TetR/AcrR family transcriptional regulator [Paenibacillus sp. SC116]MCR8842497.1 TetR/AcrR family transcriptional regulator [Paenibacillus sp. SC116]
MRTTKKPDERRKEFMDTAMALFLKNGYEKTTVEDITQTIQVAKGSFYYYFKSKQDVFEACIYSAARGIVDKYLIILNNSDKPAAERIVEYIEFNFQLSETGQLNDIFETIHSPVFEVVHNRVAAESMNELLQSLTSLIESGKQDCGFQTDDAEFTAAALLGALREVHNLLSKRIGESSNHQRRLIYNLIERIVGAKIQ